MLKVLGKRVLIERAEAQEKKTESGIILSTEVKKEPPNYGKVISNGGCDDIKEGDNVVFAKYAGWTYDENRKGYIVLRENDVIGTYNDENFKVMGERVLVEIYEESDKIKHGKLELDAPVGWEKSRKTTQRGLVKQIGQIDWSKLLFKFCDIKPGTIVHIMAHQGTKIVLNNKEHRAMYPGNILGVENGNA